MLSALLMLGSVITIFSTILAEIDMLENVEIGEQKRRNEAYEAAKKKKGIYDDK